MWSRIKAFFSEEARQEREARYEEWTLAVAFLFPHEGAAQARYPGMRQMFEEWYREWRTERTPVHKFLQRRLATNAPMKERLSDYPEWVDAGYPNPLTWVSTRARKRLREVDERLGKIHRGEPDEYS